LAEDSKKVGCIDGPELVKKAAEKLKKAILCPSATQSFEQMEKNRIFEEFHASSRVLGKVEDVQTNTDGINFKCRMRAVPLDAPFTPRHSGRYPWADIRNGKSREEIYDSVRSKKGLPSPGFIFANKDAIKFNTRVNYNIENDTVEYIFRDDRLKICKAVRGTYMDDETAKAFEDNIISELAREYDNIMIRKVLNMDSTRFNRFVSLLNAAGGNFAYDTAVGEKTMATIQIPASMLDHLHLDGDGSVPIDPDGPFSRSSGRIPAILKIQTFNDRVVQVTFIDGSQTKCVCGKDEAFDLYEGIAFCLFKRFLGKEKGHKHFNDLMRYAFKKLDKQEESKKREAEIKAENKRHEEKKKLQAQRRKAKKREEKIGIFVEALKRNRQALINDIPAYSVPEPAFKPYENPYIAPGEPEPPVKPNAKAIDEGSELFFDPLSGKTFTSSREKILLAVMTLNNRILAHDWVSVNEWYEELGLDSSGNLGEIMGWNIDRMLKIDFADDVTRDGRECLTIVYVEKPVKFEEGKA